jgi:hypothetical protein
VLAPLFSNSRATDCRQSVRLTAAETVTRPSALPLTASSIIAATAPTLAATVRVDKAHMDGILVRKTGWLVTEAGVTRQLTAERPARAILRRGGLECNVPPS